jgi:hypothetical protein
MTLSTAQTLISKLRPTKKDDWGDLVPEIVRSPQEEYSAMLNDPKIRAELAERDPAFAERYAEEEAERIVVEFRRANPGYLKTKRNADRVVGALAKRHLGKDWLTRGDATTELFKAGHWSVEEITAEYQAALAAGELDVPRGTTKPLSRREELDVIATIRQQGPEAAIIAYLTHALGGELPRAYRKTSDFLVDYPELATQASWFVWLNSRAAIDGETLAAFQSYFGNPELPTVAMLDGSWFEFSQLPQRKYPGLYGHAASEEEPEPEDLENLSNEQLDRRILEARRAAQNQRE